MQLLLLGVPFLDELGSGLPVVGAPALQHELFGSIAALGLVIFTLPQLLSLVIDPPLLVFASRFARRRVIRLGLWAYGLALLLTAWADSAYWFALAWTCVFTASGVMCASAQAELMDREPDQHERAMTQWTLGAALGDLVTPLLLLAVALAGQSFRLAWWVAAAVFLLWGLLAGRRSKRAAADALSTRGALPEETESVDAGDAERPLLFRELFQRARQNPRLVMWLFAATLCSLMDETLVAFCALWMKHRFGSDSAAAIGVTALMSGGFLGLLLLQRLLAWFSPRSILVGSCLVSALALIAWLLAGSAVLAAAGLLLLGASASMHYPLAQAAAYRSLPGASNSVAALGQLFGPVDLLIPVMLGLLADRFGLAAALLGLLLQPLGLALAASFRRTAR